MENQAFLDEIIESLGLTFDGCVDDLMKRVAALPWSKRAAEWL